MNPEDLGLRLFAYFCAKLSFRNQWAVRDSNQNAFDASKSGTFPGKTANSEQRNKQQLCELVHKLVHSVPKGALSQAIVAIKSICESALTAGEDNQQAVAELLSSFAADLKTVAIAGQAVAVIQSGPDCSQDRSAGACKTNEPPKRRDASKRKSD